jgi:hypothetical protein
MEDWTELEELAGELRQQDEERWKQLDELRQQFEALQPHVEVIKRQFSELEVDAHLHALNQRLLGGLGSVEMIHSGAGLEYIAALVWPAHVSPQAAPEGAAAEGAYRIEVWLGPGLQDGRPRIRISGSKRLEAVLPTTTARFRSALLSVFQAPQFIARPEGEPTEAAAEPAQAGEPEADAGEAKEQVEDEQPEPDA